MNFIKKTISIVMIIAMLLSVTTNFAWASNNEPNIVADAAIIYCGDSGEILYDRNAKVRMEPASMTKLMTCLIAVEELSLDQKVKITADIEIIEPTELGVVAGEEITVRDLVYGALLCSGNDAATALGIAVSGSIEEFSVLMNKKAKELGCNDTNFTNPSGLPDEKMYSTCLDMAKIAKAAMDNEFIRKVCGTVKYNTAATNMSGPREVESTNLFL